MPKDTFRMFLSSPSGGGKTNLLYHMLTQPLVCFDQIHLYGKNLEQDKYQQLRGEFDSISEHVGYDVLLCNNDKITPVENLMDNKA